MRNANSIAAVETVSAGIQPLVSAQNLAASSAIAKETLDEANRRIVYTMSTRRIVRMSSL